MPTPNTLTRPWEIWLVHHTHVDIGYTEPQDVILRKHAEFVAQALDHCAATDALPEGERFVWTCEVAWTVKAFLARYPERADEFFRRVREGRIEVTALYLQLTDLFTQELLEETTDYALNLGRQHGFAVVTAMNDDVNGWSWGLPDLLSKRGVRYLDTAINETRALGVRPRPAMFRWSGPQGGSVLFWHSNGYLTGNGLALDQMGAEERVAGFLKGLEEGGYPHHVVEVRIHGENHDNAPPGLWLSETVRRWNAAHPAGPKLRLVTPRTWFEEAASRWPVPVVEHKAGWPDWWADGNGSAARESALVRQAQADLVTLKALEGALVTPSRPGALVTPEPGEGGTSPGIGGQGTARRTDRLDRAREAAAFFCEHTWGAWCSTDTPDSLTSKAQWNTKAGFAYTAAVEARSLVQDALAVEAGRSAGEWPGILVFNPSDHVRSDVVELTVADADLGLPAPAWVPAPVRTEPGPTFHLLDEETGAVIPVWREPAIADSARRPAQKIRFLARKLPSRGFRRYRVVAGESPEAAPPSPCLAIAMDERGIVGIRDRWTGAEWLQSAEFALGEVIYESIPGPFGREKLCGWGGIQRDCPFERTSLRYGAPEPLSFPYGSGLRLTAHDLPDSLRSLTLDIVTYTDLPRVDLRYRLDKIPNPEAEAIYVAFPLASESTPNTQHSTPNAQVERHTKSDAGRWALDVGRSGSLSLPPCSPFTVHLDCPGAVMRPGLDQVPGTATDWHSLQHYFAVSGGDRTVVVASPDIPLVQVNGINTGKWRETLPPHNGLVMSWVMNNYWFTNFPAAQGGGFEWRYSLMAIPGAFDDATAGRFAREVRQTLVTTVMG